MSRALIEELLTTDAELIALGIDEDAVFNQHDIDERPFANRRFIVLRWEEATNFSQSYTGMRNGLNRAPRMLTIWVHSPIKFSTDFEAIDQILDRIDLIFDAVEGVAGSDGYTVTVIRNSGRSGDLKDEGWQTITRNGAYAVLYRRT